MESGPSLRGVGGSRGVWIEWGGEFLDAHHVAMVPRPLVERAWRKEREGRCRDSAEGREAPEALDSPMGTREATTAVQPEENEETTRCHSATLEGGPPPRGSVLTREKPQGHRALVGGSAREPGRQGWGRAGEGTCQPHCPPVWGGASTEAEVGSVSISLRAPATHQTSPLPACLLVGTRPSTQRSMGTRSAAPGPAFPTHTLGGLGQAVEYLGDG